MLLDDMVFRKDLDRVLTADEVDENFNKIVVAIVNNLSTLDGFGYRVDDIENFVDKDITFSLVSPSVNDDITKKYEIDYIWFDLLTSKIYKCTNNDEGSAVWLFTPYNGKDFIGGLTNVNNGANNILCGFNNSLVGKNCIVSGSGNSVLASDDNDSDNIIVYGFNNVVNGGKHCLIGGSDNIISDVYNVVFGSGNNVSSSYNLVFCSDNICHGNYNLVGGISNEINNTNADNMLANNFVMGFSNILDNVDSSVGTNIINATSSKIKHSYCFVLGNTLETSSDFQVLLGQYNSIDSDVLLAFGNGEDEDNRSNLFEIRKDGSFVSSSLEIVSDTDEKTLVNKKYVDNKILNISLGNKDTTANRPVTSSIGFYHFDTDLNKPIWYNGSDWTDADGSVV